MSHDHHHHHHHAHDEPDGLGSPVVVDPATESLSQALRAGFNVLRLIMIALLVFYFLSGWFQVEPGQQGIIVRFGELRMNNSASAGAEYRGTPVFGPGWHVALPDPFDEKIRLSGETRKDVLYTFSFKINPKDLQGKDLSELELGQMVPPRAKLTPGQDATLITGDRNLSHGIFAIEYRIKRADLFVRNVGDDADAIKPLLTRIAENAIVRTVAGMPVERILRTRTDEVSGDFTGAIERRIAAEMDALETGIEIAKVEAKTVEPGLVRDAFIAVSNAKVERNRRQDEARQEANRILSKAAGGNKIMVDGQSKARYEVVLDAIDAYGAAQTADADEARLAELRAVVDQTLDQAEGGVAVRLRQANARANEIRERVLQEYEVFRHYHDLYVKYPEMTLVRLWVRMRDKVLASKENELFFVPDAGEIEIITNRDLQRVAERDVERYRERYHQGQ